MVMEQYLQGVSCKPLGSVLDEPETNQTRDFECNICLDNVQDPVVTLCGHLYCWPCIYRWIIRSTENRDDEETQPRCPVCKTEVSENTLIPLYGRGGQATKRSKSEVPERPSTPVSITRPHFAGNNNNSVADPMIGGAMFGEMVYARIFGNSETTLYTYPNSITMTARQRRYMRELDGSMSRLCFFLCCCVLLCLLLF